VDVFKKNAGGHAQEYAVFDSEAHNAATYRLGDPAIPNAKGNYHIVGPANENEGSVRFTEVEMIALALIVVSVFIILLCAAEGCAIATWSSPEGGVRHSSSDVSGDDWLDRDGVGGEEVGEG
jgi:hypothetical protein